ncbi:MarR family winged helix-turn-helix transcriptional regulator [Microbacterium sediminis]|uniref:Transcriptional regulator n=1 Tax=Microbacterium sediminis TaxID=904291 RepID=A0A1B9N9G0_9MICO|nr:MarR family transcriptional regulator [Microbacterium sediminis]OCG73184.1 transcriptional regulator [Microbacterium sediminis]QBR74532.1 MarR family transcriptional regulator [Microbacterium sediminis]
MSRAEDVEALIIAAHRLTRVAALETNSQTPAAQWRTLAILRDNGPQRIGELARLSRVTQPGMTRLIGTMTELGLVERRDEPGDSRAVQIVATERGVAAYAQWRAHLVDAMLPRFEGLSAEEWAVIRQAAALLNDRIAPATAAPATSDIENGETE